MASDSLDQWSRPYLVCMELMLLQDYAIQACVAGIIGAAVFDRVFAGIGFAETDGRSSMSIPGINRPRRRSRTTPRC